MRQATNTGRADHTDESTSPPYLIASRSSVWDSLSFWFFCFRTRPGSWSAIRLGAVIRIESDQKREKAGMGRSKGDDRDKDGTCIRA